MDHSYTPPACFAKSLSVDIVEDEIFLEGCPQVAVSLTPQAALATGHALINAALSMTAAK